MLELQLTYTVHGAVIRSFDGPTAVARLQLFPMGGEND